MRFAKSLRLLQWVYYTYANVKYLHNATQPARSGRTNPMPFFALPTYGAISKARKAKVNKLVARFARREEVNIPTCILDMIEAYSIKPPLPKKAYEVFFEYVKKGEINNIELLSQTWHIDLEMKDSDGWTPLGWAARYGKVEVVKLLLDSSVNMNVKARGETTPLHLAAWKGHVEVVALLLEKGADREATDGLGERPLHYAEKEGYYKVVELLKKHDKGAIDGKCGLI